MSKEEGGKAKNSAQEPSEVLAARRARLRSSLTQQKPVNVAGDGVPNVPDANSAQVPVAEGKQSKQTSSTAADPDVPKGEASKKAGESSSLVQGKDTEQGHTLELLGNIDQALGACATHLASLQKVAGKQIDELKVIGETLQSHSFSEVGLNINTLMESFAAAVEPMKAIGELVPALDRLVSISELKNVTSGNTQLNENELITRLADQLAAGIIDPWTFKSAYQAIFPNDDTASLIHRLGELLGTQQLSGELFQSAYEAVQLAPPTAFAQSRAEHQITDWPQAKELSQQMGVTEPVESAAEERNEHEEELNNLLAVKEQELAELKAQLDSGWQDLSNECEELRSTLQDRETILKDRELELNKKVSELAAKNSENLQLRTQMEELRDQTKEMVKDLHKQLTQKQAEEKAIREAKSKAQVPQPGFFDLAPSTGQTDNLFDPASANRQLFANAEAAIEGITTQPVPVAPTASNRSSVDVGQQLVAINSPVTSPSMSSVSSQPGYASPNASFVSAAGSYGSGVRAQVFEVIVRQALAGAHWREICAVPMQINNIAAEEVEAEVKRRQALLKR